MGVKPARNHWILRNSPDQQEQERDDKASLVARVVYVNHQSTVAGAMIAAEFAGSAVLLLVSTYSMWAALAPTSASHGV